MTWSAADIALLVSTTATAVAALSGVALPLLSSAFEKRSAAKKDRFEALSSALVHCAENIENLHRHRESESMRFAILLAGKPIPDEEERKAGLQLAVEFERCQRRAQIIAGEVDIDFLKINHLIAKIQVSVNKYEFDSGKLRRVNVQPDPLELARESINQLVSEIPRIIKIARTKFNQ